MIKEYTIGNAPRCFGEHRDFNGDLENPDTAKVKVLKPDGTETEKIYLTDAEVIRVSTGLFYMDVATTMPGTWAYQWHFTKGTAAALAEHKFKVLPSLFG